MIDACTKWIVAPNPTRRAKWSATNFDQKETAAGTERSVVSICLWLDGFSYGLYSLDTFERGRRRGKDRDSE